MTITPTEVTLFVGGAAIGFTLMCVCGALALLAIADEHSQDLQRRIGHGLREIRRRARAAWFITTTPQPAALLDEASTYPRSQREAMFADSIPPMRRRPRTLREAEIKRHMAGLDDELAALLSGGCDCPEGDAG